MSYEGKLRPYYFVDLGVPDFKDIGIVGYSGRTDRDQGHVTYASEEEFNPCSRPMSEPTGTKYTYTRLCVGLRGNWCPGRSAHDTF